MTRDKSHSNTSELLSLLANTKLVGDCLVWKGYLNPYGYAQVYRDTKVHRRVYQLLYGLIPAKAEIDHTCEVRACVNPLHLQAASHAENIQLSYLRRGYIKHPNGKFVRPNKYKV